MVQAVEHALRADRLVELRALVVVGKDDLDLGAGRGIAVELGLDFFGFIGGRAARGLIEKADSHGRTVLLVMVVLSFEIRQRKISS